MSTLDAIGGPDQLTTLLRLDRLRLRGALRHPTAGAVIAIGLPLGILLGVVWIAGSSGAPRLATPEDAVLVGLLLSGPVSLLAYGVVFRAADQSFLRHLGIAPRTLYRERAGRLLAAALGVAGVLLLPFAAAGQPLGRPALVAIAAAFGSWSGAMGGLGLAARSLTSPEAGGGRGLLTLGMWDREVAAVAPLVYAPVFPLLAGTAAAAFVGASPSGVPLRLVVVGAAALVLASAAARWHERALPRFAPRVLEMTFVPTPRGAGELRVRRGAARFLPRAAAAVWARDALLVGRRFSWASRIIWPVAIVSFVALARWGGEPVTRAWVAAAAALVLLLQLAAVTGVGRLERSGRRWIDRGLGIRSWERLLGRWAFGFGSSLWLTLPLALSWSWWSSAGAGWLWVGAGALTAAAGAVASVAASGWR